MARKYSDHRWRLDFTHLPSVAELNAATATYIARLGAVSAARGLRSRTYSYNGVPSAATPPATPLAVPVIASIVQPKSLEDMCGAFLAELNEWKKSSEVSIADPFAVVFIY